MKHSAHRGSRRRRIGLLVFPSAVLVVIAALTSFLWLPLIGHGPWKVEFKGYGTVRVTTRLVTVAPMAPATDQASDTHASLVLTRQPYGDFTVTCDVLTTEQLRPGGGNPWEVGWVLWHVRDRKHFYALALKPNGWELTKQEPGLPGDQKFLVTGDAPRFPIGKWHSVRITQAGPRMSVFADGQKLTDYTDTQPYLDGAVGLYSEDAEVVFRDIDVTANGV
jgi:hypothetical protein